MLIKKYRVTKDKEYEKIFKKGQASYGELVGVKAVKNELNYSRFGIIVSNKISKQAVARNRYKRQIRGIIISEFNNIQAGYDIAIVLQKNINEQKQQNIQIDLIQQFKKLRIIK